MSGFPPPEGSLHAYRHRFRHQLLGRCGHRGRPARAGPLRRCPTVPHCGVLPRGGARPDDFALTPQLEAQVEAQLRASRAAQRQPAAHAQRGGPAPRRRSRGAPAVDGGADPRERGLGRQLPARAVRRGGGRGLSGERRRQPDRVAQVDVRLPAGSAGAQGDRAYRHAYPRAHPPHRHPPVRRAGARRGDRSPGGIPQLDGRAGAEQALEILREAAAVAGFDEVSFLEEPAAAAMHYHHCLPDGSGRSSWISAAVPPTSPTPSSAAGQHAAIIAAGACPRAVPTWTSA